MKPKTDLQELNSNEIKNIEKNLLEVFADFCEKNNLTYYISFGTLIGAVRHKGFIPWDDDIDLEMPRKDYNRLMEILLENNNHFTENIELKTPYSKKQLTLICLQNYIIKGKICKREIKTKA